MDPIPTLFGLLVIFLIAPFLVAVISGSAPTTVGSDMVFATLTKFTGSIQHYRQQSANLEGSTLTMRVSQMQRTLHRLLSTSSRCEIGRSCRISMPKKPTGPEIIMIVDRYDPMNLFELVPKLELEMEPELARLDGLLDDDVIFERVRADLRVRYPNSAKLGCHSTPAAVILRMLVLKRLYSFSYEQTERFASGSIVLGQFCRLYLEAAPDDTTLIRWANTIAPQRVASLNDRVVELARDR